MAEIDVTVCGRSYRLGCENGQERHLAALAAGLDAEARALSAQTQTLSEAKLLLMAALVMADRAAEATTALAAAEARLGAMAALEAEIGALRAREAARAAAQPAQGALFDEAAAAALSGAVARLEKLVSAHEGAGGS
jgi:cell division protein ZapA